MNARLAIASCIAAAWLAGWPSLSRARAEEGPAAPAGGEAPAAGEASPAGEAGAGEGAPPAPAEGEGQPADAAAGEGAPAPSLPAAQPHGFTTSAEPSQVRLGERFVFRIEVRDAPEQRYELPRELSLGPDFELIEVTETRTPEGDALVTRFDLSAGLFALGEKRLPDVTLSVHGPGGPRVLVVPGPPVVGVGIADPDARLADALPPVDLPVPDYTSLYVGLGLLAALVVAGLLWRAWRKRPLPTVLAPSAPPVPPEAKARQALHALRQQGLHTQGRAREFHFRLSEILRAYLGERYAFDALDCTSFELLRALERLPTPGLDKAALAALCQESDLVKFARAAASAEACEQALEKVAALVEATTPRPVPAPAAPGAAQRGAAG